MICLLAPSASAMQSLLDVCYEYGTDNDILFNPIKSVCTVFKPKAYKRFTPTVFIGDNALKFTKEAKYLGFTFSDSKCDDSDMLRQMRLLYAKSNILLRNQIGPRYEEQLILIEEPSPHPKRPPRTPSRRSSFFATDGRADQDR